MKAKKSTVAAPGSGSNQVLRDALSAMAGAVVPAATRNPKSETRNSQRACLRCGCTEDNACACGCSWVFGCDVCDVCLSVGELALYEELRDQFSEADCQQNERRAQNRLATFGRFLVELIQDEPIPHVPTPRNSAVLSVSALKEGGGK